MNGRRIVYYPGAGFLPKCLPRIGPTLRGIEFGITGAFLFHQTEFYLSTD